MAGIDGLIEHERTLHREGIEMLRTFRDITDIPHGSGNEEALLQYIIHKMRAARPDCIVEFDEFGNMAIHIPGTRYFEDAPRILIQAHADMVCLNGNDKRPVAGSISVERGKDVITAKNETLGADNAAAGIAIPLTLLTKPGAVHGPITLLMTIQEEVGLKGAQNLDPKLVPDDTALIINLDSEEGPDKIFMGCAGGCRVHGEIAIEKTETIPVTHNQVRIQIKDGPGGHSGLEIHKKVPNPIKEMNALLLELIEKEGIDLRLLSFSGGSDESTGNSVPEGAEVTIAVHESEAEHVRKIARRFCREKELKMRSYILASDSKQAVTREVRDQLLKTLQGLPNGPLECVPGHEDQVRTSNNVGVLRTVENAFKILTMGRASSDPEVDQLERELRAHIENFGAQVMKVGKYYGWLEEEGSLGIKILRDAIQQILGVEATEHVMHAGLEVGTIKKRIAPRNIPAVSFGPKIGRAHKRGEFVVIEDLFIVIEILRKMLQSAYSRDPRITLMAA